MQQTGTLRKRKRRNLAKVNGLSTIPYDETLDTFPGFDKCSEISKPFSSCTKNELRLQLSSSEVADYRRSSTLRVTRNPSFYTNVFENDVEQPEVEIVQNVEPNIKGRNYFLDKYTMQRLKQLIWLGVTSGCFPWKWNEKQYRLDNWSPAFDKVWWCQRIFVSFQQFCIGLYQLHAFIQSFKSGNHESYREVFMGSFTLLRYNYVMYFSINMVKYKDKIREYINSLLVFNQHMVQKYLIHLDGWHDSGRALINFAIIVNIFQVFMSVSLFLVMPYQPWYLFSFIYPKPFYWLIPGAIQEYMLVGQIITSYMLTAWCVVAHTNTLNFWTREIHNHNDSDFTSDEIRSPVNAFETYRALQILNKCFNECLAPIAIPMIKVVMSTALVPCGYVLIRSMNRKFIDEFPGILVYPMAVLDCSIAGFVTLSMAAEIYDLGSGFVDSWSRTKHKDFRRILMSCPSLKIWVARLYYISVSTTITFFKVVFDLITDCIIAFP